MSVVTDALAGRLTRELTRGELLELMSSTGLDVPTPQQLEKASRVLAQLIAGGHLKVRERQHKVQDGYRMFDPYDPYTDPPSAAYDIDPETGRAGSWWRGTGSMPPGAEPTYKFVLEERFHPGDMAELIKGPLGPYVEREGYATPPLKAWCQAAGESVEKPTARKEIAELFEFVRSDGKPGQKPYADIGELTRPGGRGQLKNAGREGLFILSEVKAAAERMGWTMRPRRGRGSVGGVATLNWVPGQVDGG